MFFNGYYYYFTPTEKTTSCSDTNVIPVSQLFTIIDWLVLNTIRFVTKHLLCSQSRLGSENSKALVQENSGSKSDHQKDGGILLRGEDVKMLMERLGLFGGSQEEGEEEEIEDLLDSKELSSLFDENEPSLAEVKEAFDVFDLNRDGFIDANELQRVLCILGLREGEEARNCKHMIMRFDENKDGLISFHEFVKLMETTLC